MFDDEINIYSNPNCLRFLVLLKIKKATQSSQFFLTTSICRPIELVDVEFSMVAHLYFVSGFKSHIHPLFKILRSFSDFCCYNTNIVI